LLFGDVYEDPNQLRILCKLLSGAGLQLFDEKGQDDILGDLNYIENYLMPWVLRKEERPEKWGPAIARVKAVEQKIINLKYELPDEELAVFSLAVTLANWDRAAVRNRPIAKRKISNESPKNYSGNFLKVLEYSYASIKRTNL
jgi:hypothetical protein